MTIIWERGDVTVRKKKRKKRACNTGLHGDMTSEYNTDEMPPLEHAGWKESNTSSTPRFSNGNELGFTDVMNPLLVQRVRNASLFRCQTLTSLPKSPSKPFTDVNPLLVQRCQKETSKPFTVMTNPSKNIVSAMKDMEILGLYVELQNCPEYQENGSDLVSCKECPIFFKKLLMAFTAIERC